MSRMNNHGTWTLKKMVGDIGYICADIFFFERRELQDDVYILHLRNNRPLPRGDERYMLKVMKDMDCYFPNGMSGKSHPSWKAKMVWDVLRKDYGFDSETIRQSD